jgi:hypothetical protein
MKKIGYVDVCTCKYDGVFDAEQFGDGSGDDGHGFFSE